MALRRALLVLSAGTVVSFAAGWWTALAAKPRAEAAPDSVAASPAPTSASASTPAPPDDPTFQQKILPFINNYCMPCHNMDKASGGLILEGYMSEAQARKGRKEWATVEHVLAAGEMPPKKSKNQPTKEEREFVINWISNTLTKVDCTGPKDPGRVTIRRLNRAEYNNTIRDLCGVDFKPADDFPTDDVGYGFDNIGDVLSFQPILLEKYMSAADKVLEQALAVPPIPSKDTQTRRPQQISTVPRSAKTRTFGMNGRQIDKITFDSEGSAFLPEQYNFPAEGDYILRFRGWGTKVGDEYPKVVIRVDGKDVKTLTVDAPQDKPQVYEGRGHFGEGGKRIAVAFVNEFIDKESKTSRQFGLEYIEIEGPINPVPKPDPESVKLLLGTRPTENADKRAAAEKVLANFARRAYRRPVKPEELQRLLKLYDLAEAQGEPFEKSVRLPMKAVLCSPHFLYRIEDDPKDPNGIRTINDFEFATRLSYFLWSSMPDEELFGLAQKGTLRNPGVLDAQVKRMLKDPKAKALSENFAGQWLQLRNIKGLSPDKGYFPNFDEPLRSGMVREAESYFEYVVQNDRSIIEFLDSDYTFLNDRMAKHYGIANVSGSEFRLVKLTDARRGGVITMASTLTVTSNPTRTSPVKRGKWILENILGTPPPPPAPDAGELPPTGELKGTLRQQMEQHRANPKCAACHARMDPLGFGLENFDGIGGWREQDNKQAIDATGVLPDGAKFDGPAQMKKVLIGKSDQFRRCFAEKLLTFSLGRGLEYYDTCALDEIVAASRANQDRFSAVVLAIVKSDPFQKRKGKRSE
ncbi:MAG TPA: DUF1592 domain-containing protein [Gemmataceae bacterium]|nr:DUF1592 domain-containing protein [Gemmataceae bacterium]